MIDLEAFLATLGRINLKFPQRKISLDSLNMLTLIDSILSWFGLTPPLSILLWIRGLFWFHCIRYFRGFHQYIIALHFSLSGRSGSKTFHTKRFLPRGGDVKEGVEAREVNSTYSWTQVDGTEFTLGVVVPVAYAKEKLKAVTIPDG